jgi:hypothetical protein
MIPSGMSGNLTGGTLDESATKSFEADTANLLAPGATSGMLMLLGLGLVGLGMWGRKRKKACQGTPVDGRYLALAGGKVNFRGTSLFSVREERRKKMKRVMIVLTVLFGLSISAFAQMGTGQGGRMMGGGWGWGMNPGWFLPVIIAILLVIGIVYMMKRK